MFGQRFAAHWLWRNAELWTEQIRHLPLDRLDGWNQNLLIRTLLISVKDYSEDRAVHHISWLLIIKKTPYKRYNTCELGSNSAQKCKQTLSVLDLRGLLAGGSDLQVLTEKRAEIKRGKFFLLLFRKVMCVSCRDVSLHNSVKTKQNLTVMWPFNPSCLSCPVIPRWLIKDTAAFQSPGAAARHKKMGATCEKTTSTKKNNSTSS